MNPNAIVFWAFCAGAGYLIDGQRSYGALVGLVIGLGISVLASFVSRK